MPEPIEDVPELHEVTDEQLIHHGKVFDVARETFDYDGKPITREIVRHPGAVAILALDDEGRVLLIRQYRHPIRTRAWEIPAGLLDKAGEPPLTGAQRELAEEADLAAARWDVLADFQNSPGGSDETIRVFLARDVSTVPAFERSDEEADIEVRWVPLDDVVDAVLARRVQSPSLVIGALAAQASRARDWATLAPGDEPWLRHPVLGGAPWHTR
ncbi:NUDIX domain-containing protein [Amnibacterium setariae]|uniref:NUDIX hydrolase n=1 Tax=Amnibacterium setariae TaxID=2306585 RepID=A0A3A1TVH4_9MICO|nr:NUDIX hydrolase [Amnibacterium setariae]